MCGIVGYVGSKPALEVVLEGLRRLEYRGYDSAGVAVVTTGADGPGLITAKKAGKIANLDKELADRPLPSSTTGIGHTRWATHGPPNDRNAHPHSDNAAEVAVVHNGIIENFASLREELEARGNELRSDTDTEVVAHLLAETLPAAGGDLAEAMRRVCRRLEGAFTLVAVHVDAPGVVVGARRNSPLVVGVGDGENFLASDVSAFITHTRDAIELGQDQVVELRRTGVTVTTFDGLPAETTPFHVDWDISAAEKGGYDYFMLKEIAEQPKAIADTLLGRFTPQGRLHLDEMRLSDDDLREVDKIIVIACGTSFHVGLIAKYAIEALDPDPVRGGAGQRVPLPRPDHRPVHHGDRDQPVRRDDGHADGGAARPRAEGQGAGDLQHQRLDHPAGVRRGALHLRRSGDRGRLDEGVPDPDRRDVRDRALPGAGAGDQVRRRDHRDRRRPGGDPAAVAKVLESVEPVRQLARDLKDARSVLFIGRHVGYPVALEGALKLKELAYMHAEGFAAGELKHGPIALIEPGLPVFVVVPPKGRDVLHDKMVSNIQEIRARGARTIVLVEEGDHSVDPYADHVIRLPKVPTLLQPLVATVPLQVFSCEMATAKGHDVDQPRNLAKSVTVE
jgi:glucosamine--fructose-6-phosphate aminotransferase (isomerizing)